MYYMYVEMMKVLKYIFINVCGCKYYCFITNWDKRIEINNRKGTRNFKEKKRKLTINTIRIWLFQQTTKLFKFKENITYSMYWQSKESVRRMLSYLWSLNLSTTKEKRLIKCYLFDCHQFAWTLIVDRLIYLFYY